MIFASSTLGRHENIVSTAVGPCFRRIVLGFGMYWAYLGLDSANSARFVEVIMPMVFEGLNLRVYSRRHVNRFDYYNGIPFVHG